LAEADVLYRLVDDTGRFVAGLEDVKTRPFLDAVLADNFANWKLQLYFRDGGVFDRAASRQIALYTWSGVLVIVLILSAGALAIRAVGKQIKLNKLKNDFIATVSHELKTPLASMRVLVDTLLEGNYEDQKQATEYLQLTSKENERLSRLIDNFLTFSRMERGKQKFEFSPVNPAIIAQDAADAAGAKFDNQICKFDVNIEDNLPDVSADKDALVTVLVNLLDNAYKYTGDDKKISLRVFAQDNMVCFQVTDNGIGLSKRAVKKIFGRFYQVDRTLSRQAGGTGLGLSIVKFIVDAHKGKIEVESKPGKGSEFIVKFTVREG
jgi:signal transduction histidine kinase